RVALSLAARGSETLNGADTIVRLYFLGYIGLDTVCETLGALTFQARQGLVGNTNYTPNAICLEGSNFSSVQAGGPDGIEFRIFPNPAREQVMFSGPERSTVEVFDVMGRVVWMGASGTVWRVPAGTPGGSYEALLQDTESGGRKSARIT